MYMMFRLVFVLALVHVGVTGALLAAQADGVIVRSAADKEVKAVGAVLDDFHDAAARADEARYFGHFAPEGIFMGTDATERWTVAAFRKFAAPHFKKESAWRFTPKERYIVLAPNNDVAWFDEVADSRHMGACRGTGVLRKIGGKWRITHYNLTLPIPNDLMGEFAGKIRAHLAGGQPDQKNGDATAARDTVVFIVRHAEKSKGKDPGLTAVGAKRAAALAKIVARERVTAAYATEYKRTQETVLPAAEGAGLTPTIVGARDVKGLAGRIRKTIGGRIVVAGHSNTVPMLLRALGVRERISLTDDDYGDLFIVRLTENGTKMLRLQY